MKTINTILVPTDFSPIAMNAFRYALQFADAFDASIDLMYVVPPTSANPAAGSFTNHLTSILEESAREDMKEFFNKGIAQVGETLRHLPSIETFIRIGDLRMSIHHHVGREGNQLIIMGTAGKRPGWEAFLGSKASYLVKREPCPVLVIPPETVYKPISSLCFATDLNDVATFQVGKVLKALRPFKPALHLLHVSPYENDDTHYDIDLLREMFDRPEQGLRTTFGERRSDDTVGAIFSYALQQHCDLVVMHRPDRPWFERLLIKSHTSEAVLRARLPLLIITAEDLATEDATNGDSVQEKEG